MDRQALLKTRIIRHSRIAQIILLQDLFQHSYFLHEIDETHFQLAEQKESSPLLQHMCKIAKELNVVLPISFFERYRNYYYNSVAMIDADGSILGFYRKSHIISRVGLHEHFYFTSDETGFQVWQTKFGCIGVGLSSDQWFPEAARLMVLQGAEILLYPSMVGQDINESGKNVKEHWQRIMQGHSAANTVPIVSSNRVGKDGGMIFCGSSFITGPTGEILKIADRESEGVLVEKFDLEKLHIKRANIGLLRDRRPDLYRSISSRNANHNRT